MHSALPNKVKVYNDNMACVSWSKSKTTKGLRYIQLRENSVRENKNIEVEHIAGKINPADMFSKEDKDASHFKQLRDQTVSIPFTSQNTLSQHTGKTKPQQVNDKPTGENFIFRNQETINKTNAQRDLKCYDNQSSKMGIIPIVKSKTVHHSNNHPNVETTAQTKPSMHHTFINNNDHLSHQTPQKRVKFDLSKNEIKILKAQNNSSVLTVNDIHDIQTRIYHENASNPRSHQKDTKSKFSQLSSNQQKQPDKPWSYAEMTAKHLTK